MPSQLQAKIHAKSPLAMGFFLGRGTLSYGQRSECADLRNSYLYSTLPGAKTQPTLRRVRAWNRIVLIWGFCYNKRQNGQGGKGYE